MPFSDTTNLTGIIQAIEEMTGLGDGAISGDTTLLKQVTRNVNESFDDIMPLMLSFTNDEIRWDDLNNTDQPIATFNLVANQSDYKITKDGSSLDILDFKQVRIIQATNQTDFITLPRIDMDDPRAVRAMSPNSDDYGVPTAWLKRGNTIYFDPGPNYSLTNGAKVYFERIQSYFVSADTTKTPGIPRIFHPLLPRIASVKWLRINKPGETVLIQSLLQDIAQGRGDITAMIASRTPTKATFRPRIESSK